MVERKNFLMKPKHQCHLQQWEECVYGAQSWKEKRLLCASMFITINEWTLIPKNYWKEKIFLWNQSVNAIYPNKENVFTVPNHERKGDYYANLCLSQWKDEL